MLVAIPMITALPLVLFLFWILCESGAGKIARRIAGALLGVAAMLSFPIVGALSRFDANSYCNGAGHRLLSTSVEHLENGRAAAVLGAWRVANDRIDGAPYEVREDFAGVVQELVDTLDRYRVARDAAEQRARSSLAGRAATQRALASIHERLRDARDASSSEQVFQLVWTFAAEIEKGGFHQFSSGSSGDRAARTLEALRAIGADHTASLVERAMAAFPGGPPADRAARREALESTDAEAAFLSLEREYFGYTDDLQGLLHEFVVRHRAEVRGG